MTKTAKHVPLALEQRARQIVDALCGRWSSRQGMCCCPAHDDRTPSLSVGLTSNAILLHCFAGCTSDEVLEGLTRIVDADSGNTLNKGAKAAALSIFEGTKQRFFAQLLLSMKLPSLLPAIDAALAEGNSAVIQLVSTAEAMLDRRLADLTPEEREHLEIDLSPREAI